MSLSELSELEWAEWAEWGVLALRILDCNNSNTGSQAGWDCVTGASWINKRGLKRGYKRSPKASAYIHILSYVFRHWCYRFSVTFWAAAPLYKSPVLVAEVGDSQHATRIQGVLSNNKFTFSAVFISWNSAKVGAVAPTIRVPRMWAPVSGQGSWSNGPVAVMETRFTATPPFVTVI